MIEALKQIIPERRIRSKYIDLVSFASDAGFYELIPKAVVQPMGESEIISLFKFCSQHKLPLVFRTGGTSLSGQSITDGILVDLSQHWGRVKIEADGDLVRAQPGITGAMVNAYLKPFGRKIGPDPSSISAAMIGGIVSNNASGMCCGVKLNSYHTVKFVRFILPDGNVFTSEDSADYDRFTATCPQLSETLLNIRKEIHADEALFRKIREKYLTKTTIGYSLNSFIDYTHPLDIFAHLLVGAEGTLAFISEVVMHTVPDYPHKSTALLYFNTIYDACEAIVPLTQAGAMTVELMDRASLRSVELKKGMPAIVKSLPDTASALLIEFQETSIELLDRKVSLFLQASGKFGLINEPVFTTDPEEQDFLWKIRKGLFPAVGAVRARGTTVILEDIAFPVAKLGDAILDLQVMFRKYEYHNAIIFGHAKDGNIHFVITQRFDTEEEITRYSRFMKEVVELVISKYNGTLKAEHGTGRNMAPFVEAEWGGAAYRIMKAIKESADPSSTLNPGVIINDDPDAFVKNLKDLPVIEEEVDRCIECGYCEHRCPSRNLTTSPRRRIVIRRVLNRLKSSGDHQQYKLLMDQYQYDGLATCAVDGLCAPSCPVDINTGDLVKRLRRENHSALANKLMLYVAKNFRITEALLRTSLRTGEIINSLFGKNAMHSLTRFVRKAVPGFPLWTPEITRAPKVSAVRDLLKRNKPASSDRIVYFPNCISRLLGTYIGKEKNLMETFISVCQKTGIDVSLPENIMGSCCSQIFSSKGFRDAQVYSGNKIIQQLWEASHEGRYPIVNDVSSCAYTLQQLRPFLSIENQSKFDRLTILDSVTFLHQYVLPRSVLSRKKKSVVVHPVCAVEKMRTETEFIQVARHFAEEVVVPKNSGCCGMAGDRGFILPELTESATAAEAKEVRQRQYDGYYSSTKTCEMAMSQAVGENYESLLYLVDESLDARA